MQEAAFIPSSENSKIALTSEGSHNDRLLPRMSAGAWHFRRSPFVLLHPSSHSELPGLFARLQTPCDAQALSHAGQHEALGGRGLHLGDNLLFPFYALLCWLSAVLVNPIDWICLLGHFYSSSFSCFWNSFGR